jgi:hypothetical protein
MYGGKPWDRFGPGSSALSTMFPFLKVLLRGHLGAFRAWWEKTEGAAVTGYHRLVTSPLLSFLFFLGMFLLLPQHFLGFKLLYRCGCYINIAGRKPVSRRIE